MTTKRLFALLIAVLMLVALFSACGTTGPRTPIRMATAIMLKRLTTATRRMTAATTAISPTSLMKRIRFS